ncbi:beta strand repeat-containing protein [Prosthecobacter sp.]|uniref:beta strand repeat-containing protein n=1 Tax=Prosthecobacter sp. TaxID=1965333 RepID=UPI0037845325
MRTARALVWGGALWILLLGPVAQISANPTGGVVVLGDAQIQSSVPGLTTIHQQTDRAVIDWSTFNIGSGEKTQFIVPDVTSATLNRVLNGGPSLLDGTLTSNGQVFLINASGIVFGRGSVVDVAGLTASTLDVGNRSFMAGVDMVFSGSSTAGVTNAGSIKSGGDVFLIGFQVNNSGSIRAPNGTVGLAAGTDVLIRAVGDERVIVRNAAGPQRRTGVSNSGLIEANVAELKAHGGNVYALAIRNTGRIAATAVTRQGGRIILSANGGTIENRGTLVARGPAGNGGQIRINAGSKGRVNLSGGRVDANGTTGKGGNIAVSGGEVTVRRAIPVTADGETAGGQIEINATAQGVEQMLSTVIEGNIHADSANGSGGVIRLGGASLTLGDTALISASGAKGGGSIFAGGGAQGLDAGITNATKVQIQQGAVLAANATRSGNGGTVVAFASDAMSFLGAVQARGGASGGNGGQAEISGKQSLIIESLTGHIDLSAPQGRAGTLLLDPNDILISDSVAGDTITNPAMASTLRACDISAWLEANSGSLVIQTDSAAGGGVGNITLQGTIQWSSSATLTIRADRDFIMTTQNGANTSLIQALGDGSVDITAGRAVEILSGAQILTHSGNVTLAAGANAAAFVDPIDQALYIGGQIITDTGSISLSAMNGGAAGTVAMLLDKCGVLNAGGFGVVTLRNAGGSMVGNGTLASWGLVLAGGGDFYLANTGNAVQTLTTHGTIGSLQLINTLGLTIGTVGTDSGFSAYRDVSIITTSTDHIRVNKDLSSQGGVITLEGFGIEVNGSRVSNTGTGTLYLTAMREVNVNSGAVLSVVDGKMVINANQDLLHLTGGNFAGILLSNATLTTSGKGAIELNGHGGDSGDGNTGILLQSGSTIHSTSTSSLAGSISLLGVAGGGGSGNHGVALQDAGSAITSAAGSVTITGSGTGTGTNNTGVDLAANTAITGNGAMIINTDTISIAGAAAIGGTGSLYLRTVAAGTAIGLGDGAAGSLLINSAGIGAIAPTLSHVTIGAPTSGAVEIRAATWRAPLTILTLGEITVSEQLIDLGGPVTLSGSNVVLFAGITTAGGEILVSSPVTLAASAMLDTTNGGSVINGAGITLGGPLNHNFVDNSSGPDLTLSAGLAGDVALQGAVGHPVAFHSVVITAGSLAGAPDIATRSFQITAGGNLDLTHVAAASISVTGGAGNDIILLQQVPAILLVNGAGGTDTVSFAAATGASSISAASFTSIENLIGSSFADTLVGASGGNVFNVTSSNAGTLGTLHFSSIENLTGSSTGSNQFVFFNQATLSGRVDGLGNPQAVVLINDSNLQAGQEYTIGASLVSVAGRSYAFQGVGTLGLNLGSGNDNTATSFYTFVQNLNGGGGTDQLFVDGVKVVTTPLTKPGFGTITTVGFSTSTVIGPVTNVFLQNFTPGAGPGGSDGSQTNNFNSTSTAGLGGIGGIGAQAAAGAVASGAGLAGATSAAAFLGQTVGGGGAGSMNGGGPASLGTQSNLNSSTSATAERELNMSLGGDGTVRLQNAGGLLGIDPGAGAPSTASTSQLAAGISLLAQSELAIGAIGRGEVPLTVQAGAQSITLGDPLPSLNVQQFLNQAASPQAFSQMFQSLGGDGTAHLEFLSGSITMEVNDRPVPSSVEGTLMASISPGAFGELAHALGGIGEYRISEINGIALMDATGTAATPEVQAAIRTLLSAPGALGLSLALGEDGGALVVSWDGMVSLMLDGAPAGPFVSLKLQNAITAEGQAELDHALR